MLGTARSFLAKNIGIPATGWDRVYNLSILNLHIILLLGIIIISLIILG